jgi:hypothetical protein
VAGLHGIGTSSAVGEAPDQDSAVEDENPNGRRKAAPSADYSPYGRVSVPSSVNVKVPLT